jgi:hypothetical protein
MFANRTDSAWTGGPDPAIDLLNCLIATPVVNHSPSILTDRPGGGPYPVVRLRAD